MQEKQSYEHLLQVLLNIKSEISRQIRPIEEQIVQASIEYLRETFEQEQTRLKASLEALDQKILECRSLIEEQAGLRSRLETLNDQLSRLGATPLPLPDFLPQAHWEEVLRERLAQMKAQGKL